MLWVIKLQIVLVQEITLFQTCLKFKETVMCWKWRICLTKCSKHLIHCDYKKKKRNWKLQWLYFIMVPWNHGSFNKFSSNSCLSPCEHVKVYPIWLFLATCLRSKQNIQCRTFEVREASVPFLHICSQPWQLTRNRRWDSNTPNEGLIRFKSVLYSCLFSFHFNS